MERKKHFLILLVILLGVIFAHASYRERIYNAYIKGNMTEWKAILNEVSTQSNKSNEQVLEHIDYQYGYIAWCMGNKKLAEAKQHLAEGDKNIEFLWKQGYNLSMLNSYKSAFYGYKIGLNKLQAPVLGSKSLNCANESLKLNKNNPYPYIQLGNSEFYMPPLFGGSKSKALEYFQKAEQLMEQDRTNLIHNWNYLSLLVMIANCHKELKQYEKAKIVLQKVLKTEPEFLWVKNELYPEIEILLKKQK
jgi:tetratricopeptide (TPR) repeat protein